MFPILIPAAMILGEVAVTAAGVIGGLAIYKKITKPAEPAVGFMDNPKYNKGPSKLTMAEKWAILKG